MSGLPESVSHFRVPASERIPSGKRMYIEKAKATPMPSPAPNTGAGGMHRTQSEKRKQKKSFLSKTSREFSLCLSSSFATLSVTLSAQAQHSTNNINTLAH